MGADFLRASSIFGHSDNMHITVDHQQEHLITFPNKPMTTLPAGLPSISTSKKTCAARSVTNNGKDGDTSSHPRQNPTESFQHPALAKSWGSS